MLKKLIPLALSVTLGVSSVTVSYAFADIRDEIKGKRKEQQNLLIDIAEKEGIAKDQLQKKEEFDSKIKEIERQREPAEEKYMTEKAKSDRAKEKLGKRLKSMYLNRSNNYTMQLLSSESFSDFIQRFQYIRMITKSDYQLVREYMETTKRAEEQKQVYDDLITEQDKLAKQAQEEYKKAVAEINKNREESEKIDQFFEEHADEIIKINLKDWSSGNLTFTYPGGKMKNPTRTKVRSSYGMRLHPIYRSYKMHTGVDMVGGYGTPIYAPQAGIVVSSQSAGGYGWLVTIYHGNIGNKKVFTRFAHSYPGQVQVRVGQQVKQGDLISRVGAYGQVTGAHLHFEVRVGEGDNPPYVNPAQYVDF
ncbi:peptidoglycan DD-metalloendopeptidase family protein [Hazenella sp. IB182353]|uniref:murein hydrolase activator EnvC family protein n=1 Tax=Polycladospora coralii TaxID=2771432 RepID=UPI001745F135|nr:peptidoglycan DD-metalloendopeptidase family protein [Polycladospora coralii]MBS7530712.1 peptidoglycan DD-metalloendopeptidase family protein [Polycladospora coralii]